MSQKKIQNNLNLFYASALIVAVMTVLYSVFGNRITLIHYSFILFISIMVLLLIEHKQKVQT